MDRGRTAERDAAQLVAADLIDVGAWHQWMGSRQGGRVAFDMIAARFVDGPVGLAQGNDRIIRADPNQKLPPGVKPARRIVVMDRQAGKSCLVSDGPSPDVRTDPARRSTNPFACRPRRGQDGPPRIISRRSHLQQP